MPEGHTETLQLTFILQLLAWYIKYQLTYSTVTYPPNCWHCVFNTNLHLHKCTLPQKPSILDSSHICCHDTADINVQCRSQYINHTNQSYQTTPSNYCWSSDQPTMWSKNHHDSIHQSHQSVISHHPIQLFWVTVEVSVTKYQTSPLETVTLQCRSSN